MWLIPCCENDSTESVRGTKAVCVSVCGTFIDLEKANDRTTRTGMCQEWGCMAYGELLWKAREGSTGKMTSGKIGGATNEWSEDEVFLPQC